MKTKLSGWLVIKLQVTYLTSSKKAQFLEELKDLQESWWLHHKWNSEICLHFLFLLSGFIGYLPNIKEMVADWTGEDDDSDQLFFTKIYIDTAKRVRTSLSLLCPP